MPLFNDSHDLVINGGTFNDQSITGINGLHYLHQFVAVGAMHDSQERFPPPRCYPETRKSITSHILTWIDDPKREDDIYWLNGSAGAGKSAIVQTIAEHCHASGQLAASFFFSRSSAERNNAKFLVSTIAYQLTKSVPGLSAYIQEVIQSDPSILHKSIEVQFEQLLLGPLECLSSPSDKSMIIVIDGLDECLDESMQCLILRLLGRASVSYQLPLLVLIASRPEIWISDEFEGHDMILCSCALTLHSDSEVEDDIRQFLTAGFNDILDDPAHKYTMGPIARPWPTEENIIALTWKASGQFIHASTVLKYVGDPYFRPTDRLQDILLVTSSTAFSDLDQLYMHVISTCRDKDLTLKVLGCAIYIDMVDKSAIKHILALQPGDLHLALRSLHSLVTFLDLTDTTYIHFQHASFLEFLQDRARSQEYFIDQYVIHDVITQGCVKILNVSTEEYESDQFCKCYYRHRDLL
ncbi:hypothetical protein BDQ12DRAFT_607747 [Crucibulum laeve]|uniref:NACHT domain-containing protein n=1 Tax=Crucibulum laeve TaxID=68775 RepID=A0A5C3LWY2_9AGAR|nr:hypothetical protein BDQ12DRAFT_607747 [Crucibulum laeve]